LSDEKGYDTYKVTHNYTYVANDDGSIGGNIIFLENTIYDGDGLGQIIVDGKTLTGGILEEGSNNTYYDDASNEYNWNGSDLVINGEITVLHFKNNNLGITLRDGNNDPTPLEPPVNDGTPNPPTPGGKFLEGSVSSDFLIGTAGDDYIEGNGGDDFISAGDGNNNITTGNGDDIIIAGAGDNDINAGGGDNAIYLGNGNNKVSANGNNIVFGGAGNNEISLYGNSTVYLGSGNNNVHCTNGAYHDPDSGIINYGTGSNVIYGSTGNDYIYFEMKIAA